MSKFRRSDIPLLQFLLSRVFQMGTSLCSLSKQLLYKELINEEEHKRILYLLEEFRPAIGVQGYHFKPRDRRARESHLKSIIKTLNIKAMPEDPTSESFKPIASKPQPKQPIESSICFKSRTIGAIEGMFVATRSLTSTSVKFYLELCKELNYEGDDDINKYIKFNTDYKHI